MDTPYQASLNPFHHGDTEFLQVSVVKGLVTYSFGHFKNADMAYVCIFKKA